MGAAASELERAPGSGLTKKDAERLKRRHDPSETPPRCLLVRARVLGSRDLRRSKTKELAVPDTETQHRFTKLSQGSSKISVNQFELLPELAGNPFLPRLFEMFDADQDGKLSLPEFNSAIDFFLRLQSIDDKEEFVFNMYNLSGDGFIKENELFAMLKRSTSGKVSDAQLRMIVTNTLHEYDTDKDGKLNFEEFKALLSEQDMCSTMLP